jgi:hypothetical protein
MPQKIVDFSPNGGFIPHRIDNIWHFISEYLRALFWYTQTETESVAVCYEGPYKDLLEYYVTIAPKQAADVYICMPSKEHSKESWELLIRNLRKFSNAYTKEDEPCIIFIKRLGNLRVLDNHSACFQALQDRFRDELLVKEVVFEELTIKQQAQMMRSCKGLIGPHGAGFTNMFFMQPDSFIFEINPESFRIELFQHAATYANIRYESMNGKNYSKPKLSTSEFVRKHEEVRRTDPKNRWKVEKEYKDIPHFYVYNIQELLEKTIRMMNGTTTTETAFV